MANNVKHEILDKNFKNKNRSETSEMFKNIFQQTFKNRIKHKHTKAVLKCLLTEKKKKFLNHSQSLIF